LVATRVVTDLVRRRGYRPDDRAESTPQLARDQEMLVRVRWSPRRAWQARVPGFGARAVQSILKAKAPDHANLEPR
jgi:hypothetical protein